MTTVTVRGTRVQRLWLVKGHEAIASCDDVRQDDQPTEGDTGVDVIGFDAMFLAPIGTDKIFGTVAGCREEVRIIEILHPLID